MLGHAIPPVSGNRDYPTLSPEKVFFPSGFNSKMPLGSGDPRLPGAPNGQ